MSNQPLTEERVFGAITNALAAGDVVAVKDLMAYAAPRWPKRTALVMDTIRVGLAIADERHDQSITDAGESDE